MYLTKLFLPLGGEYMKKHVTQSRIVIGFSLIFLVLFSAFSYIHRSDTLKLLPDRFSTLNDNWDIYFGEMYVQTVDLPAEINVGENTTYFATTTLPDTPNSYDHLLIRASLQDLIVYLDGEKIHEKINRNDRFFRTPLTSSWELVYLPHFYQGKELTLQIRSETNALAGTINPVHIGSADAMLFNMIENQSINFIIGLILFIFSLTSLLAATTQRKLSDNRLLYLGLLSLTTSLWIFGESKMLQFITGNPFIIGGISYLMIPLIASFISLYIKEAVTRRFSTLFQGIAVTFWLMTFVMLFIQQFDILHFIEMTTFLLAIILFLSVVQVIALVYEYHSDKNIEIKKNALYLAVLIVSFALEAVLFYTKSFQSISNMLSLGFLIFFMLLFIDTYKYINQSAEQTRRNQLLETLAYQDLLTSGLNRTAYERDLEKNIQEKKYFRLILLDLNNLKHINDNFGHTSGDYAIKTVYRALTDIFSKDNCYRIGGDEFVVLSEHLDKRMYQDQLIQLRKELNEQSQSLPYTIDVAIGSDIYKETDWTNFTHFYHYVDQLMYHNKLERKKTN